MQLDVDCAVYCYSSYWKTDVFDRVLTAGDVWCGIKHVAGQTVIACRGSTTLEDWMRDFKCEMVFDAELGYVEKGFMEGVHATIEEIVKLDIKTPIIITGHSLGAAHAVLIAALLTTEGYFVSDLVLFGCPRPGSAGLRELIEHLNIRSYRNGNDPVTHVPPCTADMPYADIAPFIEIKSEPIQGDMWFLMKEHHLQAYLVSLCVNS